MPNELPPLRSRIAARLVADRGPGKKRLWVLIAIPLGILAGLACLAVVGLYIWLARGLPSIDWARHYRPPIVTTIWSGDEQLIGEFYDERRVVVPYDRIPKRLKQAVIASEDKDFFEHGGVSFTGLMRGIYQTYVRHTRTVEPWIRSRPRPPRSLALSAPQLGFRKSKLQLRSHTILNSRC